MSRVLCIHGAWQGSWVWQRLTPLLEAACLSVSAVDLPGNGADDTPPEDVSLDGYMRYLLPRIDADGAKTWLLAHSGGGVVASQLAEAVSDRIAGIIYLAAMALPSGVGFADLVADHVRIDAAAAGVGPFLEWSSDRLVSRVPAVVARRLFFHDVDTAVADWATERLTPQPERGRAVRPTLTAARFGSVRRAYIEALDDRALVIGLQRRMQAAVPPDDTFSLKTGHCPHLVAPDDVAAIVVSLIRRHSAVG